MSTVNMRELSRNTKAVIEDVVRSGRPAIVTINGRPQVAVAPLVGAVEAAEEHILRTAPANIQAAVREGEADLIGGDVSVVEDSTFTDLEEDMPQSGREIVAAVADRLDTDRLKEAIRAASDTPDAIESVREALIQVDVLTVGRRIGDTSVRGRSSDSDIVTYVGDHEDGYAMVMMPVFTSVDELRSALIRNPDWQSLDILELSGRGLIENVDPDVTIVVDPWSAGEFRVLPTKHRTLPTERAVVAAAEFVAAAVP